MQAPSPVVEAFFSALHLNSSSHQLPKALFRTHVVPVFRYQEYLDDRYHDYVNHLAGHVTLISQRAQRMMQLMRMQGSI